MYIYLFILHKFNLLFFLNGIKIFNIFLNHFAMITVWKNNEVPVEYRARRASFGYFVELLYPVLIFFISCLFVLMSLFAAPRSLDIEDKPVINTPKYFFVISTVEVGSTGDKFGNTNTYSYLGSNFPSFQNGTIFPLYDTPSFRSYVDSFSRINIQLSIDVGDSKIVNTELIVPLEFQFTKLDKPKAYSYLHLVYTPLNSSNKNYIFNGQLILRQISTFINQSITFDEFISQIPTYDFNTNQFIDIPIILSSLSNSELTTRFIINNVSESAASLVGTETSFTLQFNTPSLIGSFQAPYYNMLKNTYIKLFYWAWIARILIVPLLDASFTYGVIRSSVHYLLEPFKGDVRKKKVE